MLSGMADFKWKYHIHSFIFDGMPNSQWLNFFTRLKTYTFYLFGSYFCLNITSAMLLYIYF